MKRLFKRYWKLGLAMFAVGVILGVCGCGGQGISIHAEIRYMPDAPTTQPSE